MESMALPNGNLLPKVGGTRVGQSLSLGAENTLGKIRVEEALRFINHSYGDPALSLSAAARHVRISTFHLCRLLRSCTGTNFSGHVRIARVRAAQKLLETTLMSVKEIAVIVGYSRTNDLDRNFVTMCGMTPITYRAQFKDAKSRSQETVIDRNK